VSNAVAIEHIDGQWAVQIIEDGSVTQRTFETLEYARNFAEGQKSRLGLATIFPPGHKAIASTQAT
jgi:hypothetical protein